MEAISAKATKFVHLSNEECHEGIYDDQVEGLCRKCGAKPTYTFHMGPWFSSDRKWEYDKPYCFEHFLLRYKTIEFMLLRKKLAEQEGVHVDHIQRWYVNPENLKVDK